MFERVEYTVARIDGDYAYLQRVDDPSQKILRYPPLCAIL